MKYDLEDTIAAVSTAYGEGGIGIVRISGAKSRDILNKIFFRVENGCRKSIEPKPRMLTYGHIEDPSTGDVIDEVLAVYMPAPHTYTTEDVVEIDCHGSIVSLRRILSICLDNGARLAEEGEFTKRAFLGGRLDLSQAEAVIDMIRAKTDSGFDSAMGQLEGILSENVRILRKKLLDLLVDITVNIDYPDEDIEELFYDDMIDRLMSVHESLSSLAEDGEKGRIVREGLDIAIIGKPNVGKSSLMNALLRESRAIVTEIPGTTRDTIEETVNIGGIPVRLTDTAGIRDTEDRIEKIGIEKSRASIEAADLVVFIVDISKPFSQEDIDIISFIKEKNKDSRTIILANKQDLSSVISEEQIRGYLSGCSIIKTTLNSSQDSSSGDENIIMSDKSSGLSDMEKVIKDMFFGGEVKQSKSHMITNVRHIDLIKKALSAIDDAIDIARLNEPFELIEIDVSRAYGSLGEIIGEEVSGDIIDEVFSRFCLGK